MIVETAENAPDVIKSLQIFALGEARPLKARFGPTSEGAQGPMAGHVKHDRDQNLMALAHFPDGSMKHARSFVSVSGEQNKRQD